MFARVTQFAVSPEHLQQGRHAIVDHVIPALRMQAGYNGGLLLGNPESGKMLTVTLWENEETMHATDEASYWFRGFGAEAVGTLNCLSIPIGAACAAESIVPSAMARPATKANTSANRRTVDGRL
jgi:hypothetical protein